MKWVISGLTSVILIVSNTISLQLQDRLVSISLRSVLGIVAAYVMATAWSSCRWLLPPRGGFSICETAHRMWLGMLSTALEEELKVPDFAEWLNSYYLLSFHCFPLFLYILTSLIKLILWLNIFPDQRQAEDTGDKDHRVPLHFSRTVPTRRLWWWCISDPVFSTFIFPVSRPASTAAAVEYSVPTHRPWSHICISISCAFSPISLLEMLSFFFFCPLTPPLILQMC